MTSGTNGSSNVSVIDTATNTVVATIPLRVRKSSQFVAVTPDGKHAYVTNYSSYNVSVIDTATNRVVATVALGVQPVGVAVTPDGKHAYVTNPPSSTVSVIDTATSKVVATVPVRTDPFGVAITPDGKHAYVTNQGSSNVSVIDTASNTLVTTVGAGTGPLGVAVTLDGKHAYVANFYSNNVSVIDTATSTVMATVGVGTGPFGVGIVPPPPGVPFLAFSGSCDIHFGAAPNEDSFNLHSHFTLSSTAPGINPVKETVKFQVGTFTTKIPPGSFIKRKDGFFTFARVIHGVNLQALIRPNGTLRYAFHAEVTGASLTGTTNPVQVSLTIGGDSGTTSVNANITH
ncbi:MAG: YncE family protein [Pseudomonadota bacterium]|nr:YncE family protein [Pseudomonadota bacterium]